MTVVKLLDRRHMTNYHRLDVGLQQDDTLELETLTDYSPLEAVTTVSVYSLSPRSIPQPKAVGKIEALSGLRNLKEFSWWGVDASNVDWQGFETVQLLSVKINYYINFDNPVTMPTSIKNLSFTGSQS